MSSKEKTEDADATERRDRSPNYPAIGLTESLKLGRALFEKEKTHPMSREVAVGHWGYTLNGRSKVLLSALKKFGILEDTPNGIRVTRAAATVLVLPPTDPQHRSALRELALKPALYRQIIDLFPDGLPSDENLSGRLMLDLSFSASAAQTAIKGLRESVELAGSNPAPPKVERDPSEPPRSEAEPRPPTEPRSPPSQPRAPSVSGETFIWDLGADVRAHVSFTGPLGPKQLRMLRKYVGLLEEAGSEDSEGSPA